MVLNTVEKTNASIAKGAAIIGSTTAAIQTALTLAQIGIEVKVITNLVSLGWENTNSDTGGKFSPDKRYIWPLLLRAMNHPLITLYSNAEVERVEGEKGNFKIQVVQHPRYINEGICTGCDRCQIECSAKVTSLLNGQKITHGAVHAPLIGIKAVPSAYVIDKNGFAPCHVACPLGINIPGFVSLLAKGKTDRALALINESAPLGGILGRVCGHPCEDNCNRTRVDSPVSIRALHRYAADNAPGGITYSVKYPPKSKEGKIAIVGSGPAGLTAAWELARLGYSPTVFEAHGVIGGMLATGIPRFRLPREVREREIEAIKRMGVDIRTGITVGRDVTFAYLKERGYRAFFLSIGAQQNNKLNIPGEELGGVVDCMSLLLALNLKVDIFVGSNVVVIGGGNAAIDAARSAFRSGAKEVTIFYRRTRAEMPANAEEVEEAIKEGVKVEYLTVPVEILGDAGRVSGIHCQRTQLSEETTVDGRQKPETIEGSDFVVYADHVVVAVGQSPNTSQLDIEGLAIESNTSVIQVNPLTLETNVPGVFAGGDCITGPNNVVEAMAAGQRAAESIDRYIQGRNLEVGRTLEPPQIAEIDMKMIEASPYKRATMPVIRTINRLRSFEETTTGLSAMVAQREAERCLNCAFCSHCMECTRVCQLGAISHDDSTEYFEVEAQTILKFPSGDLKGDTSADSFDQTGIDGIHVVSPRVKRGMASPIAEAMAIALETALEIKSEKPEQKPRDFTEEDANLDRPSLTSEQAVSSKRIGVFLCSCGGSISSIINFGGLTRKLSYIPVVTCVREIAQACTEEGAKELADQAAELQLDGVVLAACRCCNLEEVCYSCTDRRRMCQQYLHNNLMLPYNKTVEFVNIREQCAWAHKEDPKGATHKALQIISSGVVRIIVNPPMIPEGKPILPSALIIGKGTVSINAARALTSRGYQVELVSRQGTGQDKCNSDETVPQIAELLKGKNLTVRPWPEALKLSGTPGNYEVVLEYGSHSDCVNVGAVVVDLRALNEDMSLAGNVTPVDGLLERIISRRKNSDFTPAEDGNLLRETTVEETTGIFLLSSDGNESPDEQIRCGLATAARVSVYLEQTSTHPRSTAVNIDSKICRGCGDCSYVCPYIEMRERGDGTKYAYIDKALCLGCGACVTSCPTGAIIQAQQSDKQIISTLRSMLHPGQILREV